MRRGWGVVKNLLNIVKAYGTSFLELEPEPAKKKTEPVPVKNRPTPQNWWRKEFWAQGRKKFHMPGADQERTAAPSNSVTTILYCTWVILSKGTRDWKAAPSNPIQLLIMFHTGVSDLEVFLQIRWNWNCLVVMQRYIATLAQVPSSGAEITFFLYSVHTGRKLSTAHKVQIPRTV